MNCLRRGNSFMGNRSPSKWKRENGGMRDKLLIPPHRKRNFSCHDGFERKPLGGALFVVKAVGAIASAASSSTPE